MSDAKCPKCGANGKTVEQQYATVTSYKCGSFQVDGDCFRQHNDCKDSEEAYNRGRADARAEMDAKILILTRALSKIADCTDDSEAADCATDAIYKWRETPQ